MNRNLLNLLWVVIKSKKARKLSALNEMLDYISLKHLDQKLNTLHVDLRSILADSKKKWPYYDYGEGYFYQSYPALSIRGFRDTGFRYDLYKFASILNKNMEVLDIGCNAGFLSLMMAKNCCHVDAFDNNPFLIRIAERCQVFEGIENVSFYTSSYDDFKTNKKYSLILSLANHHTFDGNMRPEFRTYMERIRSIIQDDGQLIFESHPNEYKDEMLKRNLESVDDLFKTGSEKIVSTLKSIYDTNRLVVWLKAV